MKKRNSLYPIVHIPMFQIGGGKGAPEYVDPSKFKPMVEPKKINPDEMRFSDWYKAQLKAGKAGDVVTYRGKKILLDPRDFPGYKAPSGQTKPSGGTQPSSGIDPKYNKVTDDGKDRYYQYKTKDGYDARRYSDGQVEVFLPDRIDIYLPDGTINKKYNNNRTVRINPDGTKEIGNHGDQKSYVPLKSLTPPSRSNTPVKAPTAATKEQNTQKVNGPLTAITEGIDWLNEHTGDNPLGAATRFVMNVIKSPFEGGKNLAANTQTLVNEGKNEFGIRSVIDAANAFAPATGRGIGYIANKAPKVIGSFRGLGKPQMVPRNREIEKQMMDELKDQVKDADKYRLYQEGGSFIPMFDESDSMDEDYLYNDDSNYYMQSGGILTKDQRGIRNIINEMNYIPQGTKSLPLRNIPFIPNAALLPDTTGIINSPTYGRMKDGFKDLQEIIRLRKMSPVKTGNSKFINKTGGYIFKKIKS